MVVDAGNQLRAVKAWQTMWAKQNKKYVDYPPTELELKRVKENKNSKRAKKAWETMRKRGYYKKIEQRPKYDNPKKNIIRCKICSYVKKKGCTSALVLESPEYLLVNSLPNVDFYIAQNNKIDFNKMVSNKPKNVTLFYGDIIQLSNLTKSYDFIYLDFCCIFKYAQPTISRLWRHIKTAKIIAFTFCLRGNVKEIEEYKFDLIRGIQNILPFPIKLEYGESYKDSAPMVTLIFSNPEPEILEEKEIEVFEDNMTKEAIQKIHEIAPYIWSPHQIFNPMAKSNLVVGHSLILYQVFLSCHHFDFYHELRFHENHKTKTGDNHLEWIDEQFHDDKSYYYNSLQRLYDIFVEILFKNIWALWDREFPTYEGTIGGHHNEIEQLYITSKSECVDCRCGNNKTIYKVHNELFCGRCLAGINGNNNLWMFGVDTLAKLPKVEFESKMKEYYTKIGVKNGKER